MNENAHALKRNIQGTYGRHGTAGERTRETVTKTIDIESNFRISTISVFLRDTFLFFSFFFSAKRSSQIYTNRDKKMIEFEITSFL